MGEGIRKILWARYIQDRYEGIRVVEIKLVGDKGVMPMSHDGEELYELLLRSAAGFDLDNDKIIDLRDQPVEKDVCKECGHPMELVLLEERKGTGLCYVCYNNKLRQRDEWKCVECGKETGYCSCKSDARRPLKLCVQCYEKKREREALDAERKKETRIEIRGDLCGVWILRLCGIDEHTWDSLDRQFLDRVPAEKYAKKYNLPVWIRGRLDRDGNWEKIAEAKGD